MDIVQRTNIVEHAVRVAADSVMLDGTLVLPANARAIVLFAHGSGSSRFSPRNRFVANLLNEAGLATLLFDLLTADEETIDLRTREFRFDIGMLAERLVGATDWVTKNRETAHLKVGYFGSSTGAAAALFAAVERPEVVGAIVSRGGRPDLAEPALSRVRAPTLFIVGEKDFAVIGMNRKALAQLRSEKQLEIIPGATHLFQEPGALEAVAEVAREWFVRHLGAAQVR